MNNLIDHSGFQKTLKKISLEQKMDFDVVKQKADDYLNELYSQQHPILNLISLKGYQYVLKRAYSNKIDINPKEIKKLMKLMRK